MSAKASAANQSDLLLWVAGAAIALVGIGWLVVMKPWGGGSEPTAAAPITVASAAAGSAPTLRDTVTTADATAAPDRTAAVADFALDNPLRMAQLAYDAGMLVEPEEYSAWTLFARVLKTEPDNEAALGGLTKVADDLVRRGETALDQGRFDDARNTVERIRAALPAHAGAKALAAKIWPATATAKPEAAALRPVPTEPPRVERVEVAPPPPPKPAVDPVKVAAEGFDNAMVAGRLLTPINESAKHYLGVLVATNPTHELTEHAGATLEKEFLSRASQSIEGLDGEAARIWVEEAEAINHDPRAVASARAALTEHLIAMESAKPLPASELKVVNYVAPTYPERALSRGLEGWVDVEFTVGADGTTHDVSVADASHETYFRREAVAAVSQWTFEPRIYLNRPIEQRSYTRIRFVN
jgi:TonB family protein